MKKIKAFPKPSTRQPMNPNEVCEFGEILEQFHQDFHRSHLSITEDEDAESFDVFQEMIANYVPYLSVTQWVRVLGELVVGMYLDCRTVFVQ